MRLSWFRRPQLVPVAKARPRFRPSAEELEDRTVPTAYFVATTGLDTNPGTTALPWRTLQKAGNTVLAGDVVTVRAGNYTGFNTTRSGTAAARITYQADPGVTINVPNASTGQDGINLNGANYVTVQGFTVTGMSRAGIRAVGNAFAVIRGNTCDSNGRWGIFTGFSDDLLIENNVTSRSSEEHGIYASNSADRPVIRGNTVWGNNANGIHMNGDISEGGDGIISNALVEGNVIYNNGAAGGSSINCDGVQGSVFRNNLIYNALGNGIALYQIDGGGPSSNNQVVNNTVLVGTTGSNGRWGLLVSLSPGNTVRNNVFFSSHSGRGAIQMDTDSLPGFVSDYNVVESRFSTDLGDTTMTLAAWRTATGQDANSVATTNPSALFVNATGGDYHLIAGSAAINVGIGTGAPATDAEGDPRPSGAGYDVGHDEFVTAAGTPNFGVSAPSSATAGTSFTITVTARDASNNTVTGYLGTVRFTSTDAQAVLPPDYTFTAADNGTHTFTITLRTAGARTVTATDTTTSTTVGTSGTITVAAAAAATFAVTAPAAATAGAGFNYTVTARDTYGNTATGYAGTVQFTSTDAQATLPANTTLTAGTGTFSATLRTAGARTITAADTVTGTLTGTSGTVTVSAAAAATFVVTAPAAATAGTGFTSTVTARDAFGNTATGYRGTVRFTSTDPQATAGNGLPANYAFTATDNGVHAFTGVVLKTAGTRSITTTDTAAATVVGTSGTITVSAAAASTFAVGTPASATAGTGFNYTVTARDAFGNTSTGYAGTVRFTSTDAQATLPANTTLTAGTGTFSATLRTAGARTVSATDTVSAAITGASNAVAVAAAAATTVAVAAPASATAGAGFTVTVTARDVFGNTATGYAGTVHFTSTDAQAVLPADYTFTAADNGTHAFTGVVLKTAGTRSITAAAGALTGTQGGITVTAGAAASIVASSGGGQSVVVNTAFAAPLAVLVTDAFGNPVTGATVTFAGPAGGSGVTFPAGATPATGATGTASAVAKANTTAGSYSLSASVAGVATPATFNLTNTPGVPTTITVTGGNNQTALIGATFATGLAVRVADAFGNGVPNVSVTFAGPVAGAGATFPGGATVSTNAGGNATAAVTANAVAGAYTVTADAGLASDATFNLTNSATAPVATTITVVSGSGQSAGPNEVFAAPLVALVTDNFGNPMAGVSVTFAAPPTGTSATFPAGAGAVTNAAGLVSVPVQANTISGSYSITATAAGVGVPAVFGITNTVGSPASITLVSGGGQTVGVGQAFGSPLVVRVVDAFGQAVAGAQVTFAGPAGGAGVTFPAGATGTTNSDGDATVQVAANTIGGTYSVTATVGGLATPLTFTLTNQPPVQQPTTGNEFGVGSGPGREATARFFNPDGSERFTVTVFPGFTGGVRTASADFNADGVADLVVGTGPGIATLVRILDGTNGAELFRTAPFEAAFTGGVYVSAGDLTGDGRPELVITPDEGGGPRVMAFSGNGFTQIANFFGIDDDKFRGGVRTAIGDFDGDGIGDLVVAAGFGGGPRAAVFDGSTVTGTPTRLFNDFFVFEEALRNGSFVAAGDVDGDGLADLIGGGGPGGGPRVLALSGADLLLGKADGSEVLANLFAGNPDNRGGVRVAVKHLDNDAKADLVVGDGEKAGSRVTGYLAATLAAGSTASSFEFDAFAGFNGGVFVG